MTRESAVAGRRVLVALVWVVTVGMAAAARTLVWPEHAAAADAVRAAGELVAIAALPTVGGVIVLRRPGSLVGRLLMLIGLSWAGGQFTAAVIEHRLNTGTSIPGQTVLTWMQSWVGLLGFAVLLPLLVLLFPDGRLPSPRWRPALVPIVLGGVCGVLGSFGSGTLEDYPDVANPFGLSGTLGDVLQVLRTPVAWIWMLVSAVVAAAALVARLRRSHGVERAQMKWLALAGILLAMLFPVYFVPSETFTRAVTYVVLAAFPVAVGVAVLRYRLYDIDRLISRTISYALLSAVVAGLFVGVVAGLSRLTPVGSQAGVAIATLTSAAIVNPIRRRVQSLVDRRFNRAPVDASRTVDEFARWLSNAVESAAIHQRLLETVADTLEPASTSVWVVAKD